jgi:hypothetical protein
MSAFKVHKTTSLPSILDSHAIYLVAPAARPNYVEMYVTDASGSVARRIINSDDVQSIIDATTLDMGNTAVMQALSLAHMAHEAINALRFGPWQQRGEITIKNRGVVSGCTVTKSTTTPRSLNLAAGVCFANGTTYPVVGSNDAASVPDNTSTTTAAVVSAYLYPYTDGQTYRLAVTAIGQAVPDNGIAIYQLTLPANNTAATDPNLTNVTLTDVRRIEASFPKLLDSPPTVSLAFARQMRGTDWRINFDVISATGVARANDILVTNRATNGCTLTLASAADNVLVRYLIERLTD